jgi:predicted O-methyltransferase YrrM
MHIVHPLIESYIASLTPARDPILQEMEDYAGSNDFPIVGPQVGRLLEILARFSGARRILELGSGFGYSAYWFLRGMPDDGEIWCTDFSKENLEIAAGYLRRRGWEGRAHRRCGDALALAKEMKGPFDIVFNDVDKHAYPDSVEVAVPLLRRGGLFVTDNALWDGQVAEASARADGTTASVMRFNQIVCGRPDLETVILPIRDGVAVCQRL